MGKIDKFAIFVGSSSAPNVRRVLDELALMVPGDHHLITTEKVFAGIEGFNVFGTAWSGTYRGEFQALSQYLQNHEPVALLQITRPPTHGTIAGILANRHKIPFVYRYSGDRFYEYRAARGRERIVAFILGSLLGRVPIRLASQHIALGPTGKRRLIARGVDPDRITILPPTVDHKRFQNPELPSLDAPQNRSIVLFVGRLSYLKGIETFEHIIPRVIERRDDLQFVFVGTRNRELSIPPQYRDHISFIGHISPSDIPGYMAAADILAHPSLTEGVPRVLLEALATGTPVIARDVGDVASVTENTFETDEELIEALCKYESLPIDDVSPFTREELTSKYRDFFQQW